MKHFMKHFNSRTLPALLLVLALFFGAGWIAPQTAAGIYKKSGTPTPVLKKAGSSITARQAAATQTQTATATADTTQTPAASETATAAATVQPSETAVAETPTAAAETPTGESVSPTAPARGTERQMMEYLYAFSLDPSSLSPANVTDSDRAFLDVALAQNTAGLEMMQLASRRTADSQIRGLVDMMTRMHEKDQALLEKLEQQVGGNAKPSSLSHVQILPETPEGQLGFQWVDLNVVFVKKVKNATGSTFGLVLLNELIGEHAMGVETAQAAEVSSTNPSIQALARHLAQEESIHIMLMSTLRDRLYFHQDTPIYFPAPPNLTPTESATGTETPAASGTASPTGTTAPAAATETATATPAATSSYP